MDVNEEHRAPKRPKISASGGTNEKHLLSHFEAVMRTSEVPLFKTFEAYKRSLPVRFVQNLGRTLTLYKLPYWVHEDDLASMVKKLLKETKERAIVKYLAAPGGSGKTSAILPAFLKSTELKHGFTHYVYMAFDNNGGNYYQLYMSPGSKISHLRAKEQGASFICRCLEHLFEVSPGTTANGPYSFPIDDKPNDEKDTVAKLNKYLGEKFGSEFKILFHLDEHQKMCPRQMNTEGMDNEVTPGALFSRGAMGTLSCLSNTTVIATYTERPPFPPKGSSKICRDPMPLPSLDACTAIENFLKFFPQDKFDRTDRRLWATMCFRLMMLLQYRYGLNNLHHCGNDLSRNLLEPLKSHKQQKDTKTYLNYCIELCELDAVSERSDENAAELLIGIEDEMIEQKIKRQVRNTVIVDDRISCSLTELIKMTDPGVPAYNDGRDRFIKLLNSTDYLCGTPLEAAYGWSLPCLSALNDSLAFPNYRCYIKCKQVLPGRLFPSGTASILDHTQFCKLQCDVIYYADERSGKPTHPLCDIFFRTTNEELVLVDITGGQEVAKKKDNLADWISHQQGKVIGVVLAPLYAGKFENTEQDKVVVMCGKDAQKMLGGLAQVLRWFQ